MNVTEEELLEIEKQGKILKDVQQMIGMPENYTASYETGFNYAIYRTAYIIDNKNKENERLHSIIKEVRELVKTKTKLIPFDENGEGGGLELTDYDIKELLEILDKEKENEE